MSYFKATAACKLFSHKQTVGVYYQWTSANKHIYFFLLNFKYLTVMFCLFPVNAGQR